MSLTTDFLICIFSYNRGAFLENLLQSVNDFYPDWQIAIFDDGSDDSYTTEILNDYKSKGCHVHSTSKDTGASKHGGLYTLMNIALDYAKAQSYKYAYFVQDDMQFLWRDEHLAKKLESIFSHEECVMCNFNFLQKITRLEINAKLTKTRVSGVYALAQHGVADTGIINVHKAKIIDLHFPEAGEVNNGAHWHDKGFHLFWHNSPHLAWIPWPTTFRYKNRQRRRVRKLKPLTKKSIRKLSANTGYAYLEDYTSSMQLLFKPYWYAASPGKLNLMKIYIKYYLRLPLEQIIVETDAKK